MAAKPQRYLGLHEWRPAGNNLILQ